MLELPDTFATLVHIPRKEHTVVPISYEVRGRPSVKPRFGSFVDWKNPISRDLEIAFLLNEGRGDKIHNVGKWKAISGDASDCEWEGDALDFGDHTAGALDLGSGTILDNTKALSVVVRFRVDSFASQVYPRVAALLDSDGYHWQIVPTTNESYQSLSFLTDGGSYGDSRFDTSDDWPTGEWHTVVFVFDGADWTDINSFTVYLDGKAKALAVAGVSSPTGGNSFLGCRNGVNYLPGDIDFFYLFSRALSPREAVEISHNPFGHIIDPTRTALAGVPVEEAAEAPADTVDSIPYLIGLQKRRFQPLLVR
jgi:hypothetical protein